MHFNLYILSSVLVFATFVHADNCRPGLDYCGKSLLKRGALNPAVFMLLNMY